MYSNREKILAILEKEEGLSPKQLGEKLNIGQTMVFRYLKKLQQENKIIKIGASPKVFYRLNTGNGSTAKIPESFKPYLWSYDFNKIDKERNKKTIIENILNLGTYKVTKELFEIYSRNEIKEVLNNIKLTIFNEQSMNYWKLILE